MIVLMLAIIAAAPVDQVRVPKAPAGLSCIYDQAGPARMDALETQMSLGQLSIDGEEAELKAEGEACDGKGAFKNPAQRAMAFHYADDLATLRHIEVWASENGGLVSPPIAALWPRLSAESQRVFVARNRVAGYDDALTEMRSLLSGAGHVEDINMNSAMLVLIRYGRIVDASRTFAAAQ